jgi:predicted dienelactone hydrolase
MVKWTVACSFASFATSVSLASFGALLLVSLPAACSGTNGSGGDSSGGTGGGGNSNAGSSSSSGSSGDDGTASGANGSSGTATSSGTGGSSGASDDSGVVTSADGSTVSTSPDGAAIAAPPVVAGCGSTKLYQVDDSNTGARGPWPVGVQTGKVSISGGTITAEIWYPARLGSDSGQTATTYNILDYVPAAEAAKVPASANKLVSCNCYRNLPLDTAHGPYPAVIFIHGTGSFRVASLSTMTQWASRGFVVVAADHPGLFLSDVVSGGDCPNTGLGQNVSRDVTAEIAALTNATGDFAFLGTTVDMSRIGISGHSQGASSAASLSTMPNVEVDMPLADLGGQVVTSTSSLKSVLVGGGLSDSVVAYSSDQSCYTSSQASIKRLFGITGGDHLDVTDLCDTTNSAGQTAIQIANQYQVCAGVGLTLLSSLAKCGMVMPVTAGPGIVSYATTAALEETLHCQDRTAAFANLKTQWPEVGDYQHTP